MKFSFSKKLIAIILLSSAASLYPSFTGVQVASKQTIKFVGKLTKEFFTNEFMTYLNRYINTDYSMRFRTTLDGNFVAQYGDLEKNPRVEVKGTGRFRFDVGQNALVKTAPATLTIAGTDFTLPSADIQKSVLWLRELYIKVALDQNPEGASHFVKFGSFPYELGRGIALGSAYISGGFLGLNPRFSIDQFASGALLHTDNLDGKLITELYFAILNNPNSSPKENAEIIRSHELLPSWAKGSRGPTSGSWVGSLSMFWKALDKEKSKLFINPYAYMHPSPDQALEFTADSNSQLYGIGSAAEFTNGKFGWGCDGAIQRGRTNIKAWDRNYTTLINNGSTATFQYTKVYTDQALTTLAFNTNNLSVVNQGPNNASKNGQEIGSSGLYNALDRFRPEQRQLYYGYFFVTDMSYELIDKQLKMCIDAGCSSGQLDSLLDANSNSTDLMNQSFNGYVPIQSVYSGKRIQHLVMLNTGVPRITVQDPYADSSIDHVSSRVTGTSTLTDKFTNLAFTGGALEWRPKEVADQKLLIKPAAIYYWMMQAPLLKQEFDAENQPLTRMLASHSLGTALSLEVEATLMECLNVNGYVGLMVPGKQYKQFTGLQLKGGTLGHNVAYVASFQMNYKF